MPTQGNEVGHRAPGRQRDTLIILAKNDMVQILLKDLGILNSYLQGQANLALLILRQHALANPKPFRKGLRDLLKLFR